METPKRCGWVKLSDPVYVAYHDQEWGKPLHDDRALFELFSLETQCAGLSWLTVLKKREGYREAFAHFDLDTVAGYDQEEIERIMESGLVIKSRPKIQSIIHNAGLFCNIRSQYGSLDAFFWGYVNNTPAINPVPDYKTAPTTSRISDTLTKDLKKRGFKFIGSTTIYAFMQACGMVDDHEDDCFCKQRP